MKIKDYLLNQSSLAKAQFEKNHKLLNDLLLQKSQNISKINSKDERSYKELLKEENDLFLQLYAKTKKYYPTKVEETFKDLIYQYRNNDYIIPDLSDKKNLFNQNPLLLVGRDLDQFYMYNEKNKKKSRTDKLNHKHLNFIKKEMLFIEKIINQNNEIKKTGNDDSCENNDNKNNNVENDISNKNEKKNYLTVDSVWDKIKKEKERHKYMERFKLLKKKKKTTISLSKYKNWKNLKINISGDKSNHKESKKMNKTTDKIVVIDSYNNTHKNKNSKSIKNINNFSNLKSLNSMNTMNSFQSIKNMHSIDTVLTNLSRCKESSIKQLKYNLLNTNTNIFSKN